MSATDREWTFRPALKLMAGRLAGFVATFLVPVVLARVFAPSLFGTYKQLFLIFTAVFALAQVGMAESLFYFLPREPERIGGYLANSLIVLFLSGTLVLGALWLGAPLVARWLGNPALASYVPLIGAYLLLMLTSAGLEITLVCRQRYVAAAVAYAASDALRAASLIVPALLFASLRWVLVGAILFGLLRLALELAGLRWYLGDSLRPSRELLAKQYAYILPFQLAVVVEVAHTYLHQFAVAHWFDPATFAIYAVGCLQIPLVDFAASSAGNVLMVGMGTALKDGEAGRARLIWRDTTKKLALLLVPLFVLLFMVAGDLIPLLYTRAYLESVPVFMIWALTLLPSIVQTDSALRVYAEVGYILRLSLIRLAVIAAAITAAVAVAGLVGAVAATLLGIVVAKLLALVRLRRLLATDWRGLLPWRDLLWITAGSLVAAVPVALVRPLLAPGTLQSVVVSGATYAAGCGVLWLLAKWLQDGAARLLRRPAASPLVAHPPLEPSETR